MGIVSKMVFCLYSQTSHDIQAYVPGVMHVYEWIGPISLLNSVYVPGIYSLNIYCDSQKHFLLTKLVLDNNTVSVVFVNQVSGVTPVGLNIDPLCWNSSDTCIQWSPNGPDKWPDIWELFLPNKFGKTIPVTPVTAEMIGHSSLAREKSSRGRGRFPQWPRYDKLHAVDDHYSVIAVATKLNGPPVNLQSMQSPTVSAGKFVIPFPDSFLECSVQQRVAFIEPEKYRALKKVQEGRC